MPRRQITTEFEHRWVEMPASHEAAWWAGIDAVVDLVRQEVARRATTTAINYENGERNASTGGLVSNFIVEEVINE